MTSSNLAHIRIDDLDILGYSVAGEETLVAMPQVNVCFDIGRAPQQAIPVDNLLLTHGHMDHSAGIAYYLSQRNFCGQKPGTVLLPANLAPVVTQLLECWGQLDGQRIPASIIPMQPGQEYQIKPNHFARAFATRHTRGSLGYTIIETRKKLRPELHGLSGPEIMELKKRGESIDYTIEIPIVSYFGDTSYMPFHDTDYIANSRILIIECTFFIDDHTSRAEAGKHMHVSEIADLLARMNNEHIIITHLTQRTSIGEARHMLRRHLPPEIFAKTLLLMDRKHLRNDPPAGTATPPQA